MKNKNWIYQVFLWTFILSIIFSYTTNIISLNANIYITSIIIIAVIGIGIVFDMLGVSAITAKESTFHAKASKKIKGAKESINLLKNNVKVSSVCNDIVGDICGIISGGLGAVLAINITDLFHLNITVVTIVTSAIISALTVGGKAIFKNVAYKNADTLIESAGKIISLIKKDN